MIVFEDEAFQHLAEDIVGKRAMRSGVVFSVAGFMNRCNFRLFSTELGSVYCGQYCWKYW